MFSDCSEVCKALKAELKKIQIVLCRGFDIGTVMVFDTCFGEMNLFLHDDLEWNNKDDRARVHIHLQGKIYKGDFLQDALEKVKETYSI